MKGIPHRRRLGLRGELMLALVPTLTVLVMLALVEALTRQRLLFASLSSSAFLIYLDPGHATNHVRTLILAQLSSAVLGMVAFILLGPGYLSAGVAMVAAIMLMVVLDVMHPPAVSTALSFGLRAGPIGNLALFGLALGITVVLVMLQRVAVWMLRRADRDI